jgi:hypothetical protein
VIATPGPGGNDRPQLIAVWAYAALPRMNIMPNTNMGINSRFKVICFSLLIEQVSS